MTGSSAGWWVLESWPWYCWRSRCRWSGAPATLVGQVDRRPIWIEPGEYKGPPDAVLDQKQVDAIAERAQRLKF